MIADSLEKLRLRKQKLYPLLKPDKKTTQELPIQQLFTPHLQTCENPHVANQEKRLEPAGTMNQTYTRKDRSLLVNPTTVEM